MAELDKITLKMALLALVLSLVGCIVGWLGGVRYIPRRN